MPITIFSTTRERAFEREEKSEECYSTKFGFCNWLKLKKPVSSSSQLCLRLCSHLFELNTQQLPTTKLLRKLLGFSLSLSISFTLSLSLAVSHPRPLANKFLARPSFSAFYYVLTFMLQLISLLSAPPLGRCCHPKCHHFQFHYSTRSLFHTHTLTLPLTFLSFTVKFSYRVESKYRVFRKTKIY